jgi:exosortase
VAYKLRVAISRGRSLYIRTCLLAPVAPAKHLILKVLQEQFRSVTNALPLLDKEIGNSSGLGTVAREQGNSKQRESSGKNLLIFLGVLGVAFAWYLGDQWTVNPQYYYGWGVPVLAAYLFWKRWQARAEAERPEKSGLAFGVAVISLLLLLPMRLLQGANPDWRLVSWCQGALIIALGFCGVFSCGGKRWVRHFAFPLLFLAIAFPWPTRVESLAVSGLTEIVVRGAREALVWMGYAVWKSGRVIYFAGGAAGVEDACSGIRSLQGTIMGALFLGEIFRLTVTRRVWLFVVGLFAALASNLARTVFLTTVAIRAGDDGVKLWHDGAGLVALVMLFGALFGGAYLLSKKLGKEPKAPEVRARGFISKWAIAGTVACLVLFEATAWGWFPRAQAESSYRVKLPGTVSEEKIDARIRSILCFNSGQAGSWQDQGAWTLYNFGWNAGSPGAAMAKYHSPEICLPSVGMEERESRRILVKTKSGEVPFNFYRFESLGQPVFVFYTLFRSGRATERDQNPFSTILKELSFQERIARVFRHERPPAIQSVEIIVTGNRSVSEVERRFREIIPAIL